MHLNLIYISALLIFLPSVLARLLGECSSGNGVCVRTTSCTDSGGTYVSGLCPYDPVDIKCCNKECNVNGVTGHCKFKNYCKGNTYVGYCPGGNDFLCCIENVSDINYGSCTTDSGLEGICNDIAHCEGTSYSGYCPGDRSIQCCVSTNEHSSSSTKHKTSSTSSSKHNTSSTFSSFSTKHEIFSTSFIEHEISSTSSTKHRTSSTLLLSLPLLILIIELLQLPLLNIELF